MLGKMGILPYELMALLHCMIMAHLELGHLLKNMDGNFQKYYKPLDYIKWFFFIRIN